ncbi:unnamed protein product [Adineta ricciae]|nr:unnamed protein product [Adineta ricciae]
MALHKLSKPKTFHVDYCGCTAAALLLSDQTIRDAIDIIHQAKSKRDFVKTSVTISKDGVKIIYNNEPKFSTIVPATMIAGSTVGKPTLHNNVGVVYISPLTGQHYPAFVHVYRCDSSRVAQKFLSRLRAYLSSENHRFRICQLEQQLLDRNLLDIERFNAAKAQKTSSSTVSSPTTTVSTNESRKEARVDPIKTLTEEFQKKIDSHEPILFPPKDYDTLHTKHGDVQRAQAWKSTEPTIVGYSALDPDDNRMRHQISTNSMSVTDERKNSDSFERNKLTTSQTDPILDPVETVSLAFDFLKDETSSIFTDTDGNIEHIDTQQHNKLPVYRFRPPQIAPVPKKILTRNNDYDLAKDVSQIKSPSRNDPTAHNHHQHHYIQNGHRTPSETRLYHDERHRMHFNPHFENRLINGSGVPISTNPLWLAPSPTLASSQPNLLLHHKSIDTTPLHRQSSPQRDNAIPSMPLKNPMYASNPDNRSDLLSFNQRKSTPAPKELNRKHKTQSHYFDTNEFILCASNGQPLRNRQHPNRYVSKEYRPHSMNVNGTLLDVYY